METEVLNDLNKYFIENFNRAYAELNLKNKEAVLTYSSAFFRKWIYSALINDTLVTPSAISQHYGVKNIYPMFSNSSIKKIGFVTVKNIQYSIKNHPICRDFKLILKAFARGINLDEDFTMSFQNVKSIKGLSTIDIEYVKYLTVLGLGMGYIEKMPSINTVVYTTTSLANEIENISNKDLLDELVNEAFDNGVQALSMLCDDCDTDEIRNIIEKYISSPISTDELYGKIFKEEIKKDNNAFDDFTAFSEAAIMFERGMTLDRELLTPFAYYFKFLNLHYMYEYSFEEEMNYLDKITSALSDDIFDDEDFEFNINSKISSMLYTPSTLYVTTSLGKEYFNIKEENSDSNILNKLSVNEVMNAVIYKCDDITYDKIFDAFTPILEICDFAVENESGKYKVSVCSDMLLSEFNTTLLYINYSGYLCSDYRFFKLPENIFTEYKKRKENEAGLSSQSTTVGEVFKEKDDLLCHEATLLTQDYRPAINVKHQIKLIEKYSEKRTDRVLIEPMN